MLSSNFRCGKIDKINCYEFGHTLLVLLKSDSDVQQTYETTLKTLHYHNLEMGPISLSFSLHKTGLHILTYFGTFIS